MARKNGLATDLANNRKLKKLIESGEVVYHPRRASKADIERAKKGQFKTIRLKKGVKIAHAAKSLH